jgi:DNA-binding PadR family transcriptional regulator
VDLLKFSLEQGVAKNIYQKDLVKKLNYSNKTIIENLKTLTKLRVIDEAMEKNEKEGRIIWVKCYRLTDLGKWFALLMQTKNKSPNKKNRNHAKPLPHLRQNDKRLAEELHIDKACLKTYSKKNKPPRLETIYKASSRTSLI